MTSKNIQLPSDLTHEAFGEVNLVQSEVAIHVQATLLMEPEIEGMQTGIALDGSSSMRSVFGRLKRTPPREVFDDLLQRGMIERIVHDGKATYLPTEEAIEELKTNGHWGSTENVVEGQAREMTAYLANNLDEDGGTTVIYWACGQAGEEIEVLGDLEGDDCNTFEFRGPDKFGDGTQLLPAMKYFIERFEDANFGFYVFMTDGALDDLEEVKAYTTQLCVDIAAGTRNNVKCVLIGVGHEVQREQLEQLDDLETGTDIDIWDHKVAVEMRGLMDIFAEVVDENTVVAPEGAVEDHNGNVVKQYTNGLPASLEFILPVDASSFTLRVGEMTVTQDLP